MVAPIPKELRKFFSLRHIKRIFGSLKEVSTYAEAKAVAKGEKGKAFLDMLGIFAEFETKLRRERQAEGIKKAKANGVYKGRKTTINRQLVEELKASGLGASAIASQLNCDRTSVYRVLR